MPAQQGQTPEMISSTNNMQTAQQPMQRPIIINQNKKKHLVRNLLIGCGIFIESLILRKIFRSQFQGARAKALTQGWIVHQRSDRFDK